MKNASIRLSYFVHRSTSFYIIQQFRQCDGLRVFVNLKLPPVFSFWYLLVQRGAMEADIPALHIPDFLCNCVIVGLLGSVKHSEAHFVSATRSLGKYAVLMFPTLCELRVVLRHPHKNIPAFPDINDFAIQKNRINSRTFKLRR